MCGAGWPQTRQWLQAGQARQLEHCPLCGRRSPPSSCRGPALASHTTSRACNIRVLVLCHRGRRQRHAAVLQVLGGKRWGLFLPCPAHLLGSFGGSAASCTRQGERGKLSLESQGRVIGAGQRRVRLGFGSATRNAVRARAGGHRGFASQLRLNEWLNSETQVGGRGPTRELRYAPHLASPRPTMATRSTEKMRVGRMAQSFGLNESGPGAMEAGKGWALLGRAKP